MPSGKTHDLVTLLLVAPTFGAGWMMTGSLRLALIATCAMLFGGLIFGPDLDIQSRQYTRWGVFRFLWLPYKVVFRHRSRWSHGILFGTLIRVVYFAGVLAMLVITAVYLRALVVTGQLPDWIKFVEAWQLIRDGVARLGISETTAWAALAGLWWGAASHTLTDVACSIARKSTEIF